MGYSSKEVAFFLSCFKLKLIIKLFFSVVLLLGLGGIMDYYYYIIMEGLSTGPLEFFFVVLSFFTVPFALGFFIVTCGTAFSLYLKLLDGCKKFLSGSESSFAGYIQKDSSVFFLLLELINNAILAQKRSKVF